MNILRNRSHFLNNFFFNSKNKCVSLFSSSYGGGGGGGSITRVRSFDEIPGPGFTQNLVNIVNSGGLKNLTAIQAKKFDKYGPIFKDKLLGKYVVNLCDVEAIETVYRAESKFPLRPPFEVIAESWREFGGILGNDYECWMKIRSYTSKKMLRPIEVQRHNSEFNEIAADLVRRFKRVRDPSSKIVNNIELEAMGWSGETMGKYVYGERLGFYQEPQNTRIYDFMNASKTFAESLVEVASGPPIWKYIQTPGYKRLINSIAQLEAIGDEFIEIIKKRHRENPTKERMEESQALFDHFITLGGLTPREMNTIALGLTQAAFEGTSFTAQWILYHLSLRPDIQEKAYQEIISVCGESKNDIIPHKSLKAMTYIKACIKEAQRLSPTALFLSRLTETDLILGGYFVPAGTEVFLFPSLLTTSAEHYENPLFFEPERWTVRNATNPYVYLPFGHGVRMCVGRRVAEMMLLVFTAHVIRSFKLQYVGKERAALSFRNGVHRPNIPLEIGFQDRT